MFSLFTRTPPHPFCCTVVCTRAKFCAQKNAAVPAAAKKGGASLFKKRCPSLKPSQRKFHVGSLWLEWPLCLRNENACQVMVLNDLVCSYLRCRSADLVEVHSNFRLTGDLLNAASAAMPHSARSLPPSNRHSRLTVVRRSCNMQRNAGIHGEAMYTALTCRRLRSSSSERLPMCGVEGSSPRLSLGGSKGGYSLS